MTPEYRPLSAWAGHENFLYWLIGSMRPRLYVELGVHTGYSYFCACQAVAELKTRTQLVGIDTWEGDEHSGPLDKKVFEGVTEINEKYKAFSDLMRSTFDNALPEFADGSVSILHIDGCHGYDDVKHDFESWLPKLRPGSVVLLHDVTVEKEGFGVRRYWNEIRNDYPNFQFPHASGLG